MKAVIYLVFFLLVTSSVQAREVFVKSRGMIDVDNGHFQQFSLRPSSLVKELYYDQTNQYIIVRLRNAYHQYCSVPNYLVDLWTRYRSHDDFYINRIKGRYDCRNYPAPIYE